MVGLVCAQASVASGQRNLRNTQPDGGLIGDGRSHQRLDPFCTSFTAWNGIGTADINALVYGCLGSENKASDSPSSTALPKYPQYTIRDVFHNRPSLVH